MPPHSTQVVRLSAFLLNSSLAYTQKGRGRLWVNLRDHFEDQIMMHNQEFRPSPVGGVESWGPRAVQPAPALSWAGALRCAGWCKAVAPETWRHSASQPPHEAAALQNRWRNTHWPDIQFGMAINQFRHLICSDCNGEEMRQIKRPRLCLISLSPLLGGRTRCVVSLMTSWKSSSSRTSMPVEEAILAPSGDVTNRSCDGKRDRGLKRAHSKHDWHPFCVISRRGKRRCTYLPCRVWSTGCLCIMNPLSTERLSWCMWRDLILMQAHRYGLTRHSSRTLEHYRGTRIPKWRRHYCAYRPLVDVPVE